MQSDASETAEEKTVSPSTVHDILEHKWMLRISAILAIVLGILAILMPLVATFAANLVIGAILAVQGIVDAVLAFRARTAARIAGKLFLGIVTTAAGVLLILFPVFGVLSLTIWLAAYFAASGLIKCYWAFQLKPASRWGWMAFSGILGIAIAALIFTGLPTTALWVLGMLVGIDLIFVGFATLMLIPRAKEMAALAQGDASAPSHMVRNNEDQADTANGTANDIDQKSSAEVFIRQPAKAAPQTES